jgi:hypothetical protein
MTLRLGVRWRGRSCEAMEYGSSGVLDWALPIFAATDETRVRLSKFCFPQKSVFHPF